MRAGICGSKYRQKNRRSCYLPQSKPCGALASSALAGIYNRPYTHVAGREPDLRTTPIVLFLLLLSLRKVDDTGVPAQGTGMALL